MGTLVRRRSKHGFCHLSPHGPLKVSNARAQYQNQIHRNFWPPAGAHITRLRKKRRSAKRVWNPEVLGAHSNPAGIAPSLILTSLPSVFRHVFAAAQRHFGGIFDLHVKISAPLLTASLTILDTAMIPIIPVSGPCSHGPKEQQPVDGPQRGE